MFDTLKAAIDSLETQIQQDREQIAQSRTQIAEDVKVAVTRPVTLVAFLGGAALVGLGMMRRPAKGRSARPRGSRILAMSRFLRENAAWLSPILMQVVHRKTPQEVQLQPAEDGTPGKVQMKMEGRAKAPHS